MPTRVAAYGTPFFVPAAIARGYLSCAESDVVSRRLLWGGILTAYVSFSVAVALTKRPWCDEAWFASPALNLLEHGSMATTNLEPAGTWQFGLDRRTYWIMPLHILVQTAWYRIVGFGLFAMRTLSMSFGLVLIGSWWMVVRRLTGNDRAALLTAALLAIDYIVVKGASDGRMDVMCAALGAAGLASYLYFREEHLDVAVFVANSGAAAGLLTHPNGICGSVGVLVLTVMMDRSRVRWRHLALAAAPYVVGFGAWGVYILQDPQLFISQVRGNADGRLSGLSSIVQHVIATYGPGFGFQAHWAGPIVHLRILILIGYVSGVAGLLLSRELRRAKGPRMLAILTGVYFALLSLVGGPNAHDYLVHIVPLYLACLAMWTTWIWDRRTLPRWLVVLALSGFVTLQTGSLVARVASNPYGRSFMPVIRFLDQNLPPGAVVMASAEFGFHLGFVPSLVDDPRLGYYSGKHADYVVVDDRYQLWFDQVLTDEPDVLRHVLQSLERDYVKIYDSPLYAVYRSRLLAVGRASR